MRVDITGRHADLTPAVRQLISKKVARLERVLNDRAVSATVILTSERYRCKTEFVLHARGDHTMSGKGEGKDWTMSIRQAAAKTEQQARKLKSKWTEEKRKKKAAAR
jgi:putative sigma-54 modulation protein